MSTTAVMDLREFADVRFDYAGSYTTCFQYNHEEFQKAIDIMAASTPAPVEAEEARGGELTMPKGAAIFNRPFRMRDCVHLEGQGRAASVLLMSPGFAGNQNWVSLGDDTVDAQGNPVASMGSRISKCSFIATGRDGDYGKAIIHSNRTQHCTALDDVYISGGHFTCVKYEIGAGGASWVGFRNVETTNEAALNGLNNQPQWSLSGGSVVFVAESLVVQGPSAPESERGDNIGIAFSGPGAMLKTLGVCHFENVAHGLRMYGGRLLDTTAAIVTGSPTVGSIITVQNGVSLGTTAFGPVIKNGAQASLTDGRSLQDPIEGDIFAPVYR